MPRKRGRSTDGALALVEETLRRRRKETAKKKFTYFVPSLWTAAGTPPKRMKVNPFDYYLSAVGRVRRARPRRRLKGPGGGEWTRDAVIYNMFVRTTAAFDHDGDGSLVLPVNPQGFRETGTFLKAIVMLPYIKRLGADTVHLLPITSIGKDGNKGNLGSPYAIRNPYELDENLSEPLLGLDARTEFRAFVEAAHRLGIRVVAEFVFRTAAKDADWVREKPEWFYWIRDAVPRRSPGEQNELTEGSPFFTPQELGHIHHEVQCHRFSNLTPPHQVYRDFFTRPPAPEAVTKEDGRWVGTVPDGTRVRIPGAFADWPPDDNQPPWGDVTYLRMYEHPDFNYIAYNTIRMYDDRLARPEHANGPLWERIAGIIPYYQREFGIDGVMIDMGHALPMALKKTIVEGARKIDPDFAFWDENFSINARSREEGYNAVFGFLWVDEHHPDRLHAFVRRCATEGFPIAFFATPENHNTPRAAARPGGEAYARSVWVINSFLPGVPFIHSGYELAETYPINTGLDFTREELEHLPSESLPLFSARGYDWLRKGQFPDWVAKVARIREQFRTLVTDPSPQTIRELPAEGAHLLCFARRSRDGKKKIAIVANTDYAAERSGTVRLETRRKQLKDLLTGRRVAVSEGTVNLRLAPGQCMLIEH